MSAPHLAAFVTAGTLLPWTVHRIAFAVSGRMDIAVSRAYTIAVGAAYMIGWHRGRASPPA